VFQRFFPPFHRSPEAKRFRAGLNNMGAVRNAIEQSLAQARISSENNSWWGSLVT
jgi:hypothetical protein